MVNKQEFKRWQL